MNSACVPVANRAIGSAPYLIDHGRNGFVYENMDELCDRVKCLLEHTSKRKAMAHKAHATVSNEWNAETAAERFLALLGMLLRGEQYPYVFADGPCGQEG
jgi:glycosyltransferase involved in cell wall biosynthesis